MLKAFLTNEWCIALMCFSLFIEYITCIVHSVANQDSDLHLTLYLIAGVMWEPFRLGRGSQTTRATGLGWLTPGGPLGSRGNVRQKRQELTWDSPDRRRLQIQNPVLTDDKSRKHFWNTKESTWNFSNSKSHQKLH